MPYAKLTVIVLTAELSNLTLSKQPYFSGKQKTKQKNIYPIKTTHRRKTENKNSSINQTKQTHIQQHKKTNKHHIIYTGSPNKTPPRKTMKGKESRGCHKKHGKGTPHPTPNPRQKQHGGTTPKGGTSGKKIPVEPAGPRRWRAQLKTCKPNAARPRGVADGSVTRRQPTLGRGITPGNWAQSPIGTERWKPPVPKGDRGAPLSRPRTGRRPIRL